MTDYLQGKVKVDEYVTHYRTLADISEGFHDMHVSTILLSLFGQFSLAYEQSGDCIRCVVDMA